MNKQEVMFEKWAVVKILGKLDQNYDAVYI